MAGPLFFDRVFETTTSVGTGTVTLLGASPGFQSFSVVGNGNTCNYVISDSVANTWEVGLGTYTASGTTLSRSSVLSSSNSGSLVSFAAGTKDVALTVPSSLITSLLALSSLVPSGSISAYGGSSLPSGWLGCDGALVSRTTYAALFTAIGVLWGSGDGSSTFKLPDLRGRTLIGSGTGASLTARTLAAIGGTETHVLTIAELAAHTHTISRVFTAGTSVYAVTPNTMTSTVSPQQAGIISTTGSNAAHNNMSPFAVVAYIVKT